MKVNASDLIDKIYAAGAQPEQWPEVLHEIGRSCGAAGGLFFIKSSGGLTWVSSPEVAWIIEDYIAEGWIEENVRGAPLIAELPPAFRTDSDYRSAEERAILPVYRDFLIPRGVDAAAGTVIQGAGDAIVLTLEGFASHDHSRAAVPFLNRLRPHLARALTLSARLREREKFTMVESIGLLGTPAAFLGNGGKLEAANHLFNVRLGNDIIERKHRLAFLDRTADLLFVEILARQQQGGTAATSFPLRTGAVGPASVIHLMPLRGRAAEMFGAGGMLLLLADGHNANLPGSDLLRMLFDLTPAEARLARRLMDGDALAEAAQALGVQGSTARTQLKRIFIKTGVNRQSELVLLLAGYAPPASKAAEARPLHRASNTKASAL